MNVLAGGITLRMINIRELRGADIERYATAGELIGIKKNRALIGVVVPVTSHWVEHVIEHNWSRVVQSIGEGERAMAEGNPMVTLDALLAHPSGGEEPPAGEASAPDVAARALRRFVASVGVVESEDSDLPPVRGVRVGDLSARAIERAGDEAEILALTHDGALLGIVVPVTQRLVNFLVGKNISRVIYNVHLGEKETASGEPLSPIEEVLAERPDLIRPAGAQVPNR